MLVPKCALSQFANWDPSLRTRIYLSQNIYITNIINKYIYIYYIYILYGIHVHIPSLTDIMNILLLSILLLLELERKPQNAQLGLLVWFGWS